MVAKIVQDSHLKLLQLGSLVIVKHTSYSHNDVVRWCASRVKCLLGSIIYPLTSINLASTGGSA